MDQNRQKLLIGALAVVALGAGSYYMFLAPGSAPPPVAQDTGEIVGKVRERKESKAAPTKTRTVSKPSAPTEPLVGKTREAPTERDVPTGKTRTRAETKVKKKDDRPIAG